MWGICMIVTWILTTCIFLSHMKNISMKSVTYWYQLFTRCENWYQFIGLKFTKCKKLRLKIALQQRTLCSPGWILVIIIKTLTGTPRWNFPQPTQFKQPRHVARRGKTVIRNLWFTQLIYMLYCTVVTFSILWDVYYYKNALKWLNTYLLSQKKSFFRPSSNLLSSTASEY